MTQRVAYAWDWWCWEVPVPLSAKSLHKDGFKSGRWMRPKFSA